MSWVAHSVKSSLLLAFRYLLKPLVRMAVKNGVLFPEFSTSLKQAYIDVARRQTREAGDAVTSEGIFVITGIESTDVERTLRSAVQRKFAPQEQSPLPRILEAWHTDVKYTGPYGVLRDLEFTQGPAGGLNKSEGASFSDLVAQYCPDMPPRPLLDELVRTGCVREVGNGFYRAITRSYVADPLSDESIRFFSQVVHNLCETLEVNLRPESRGRKGLIQRTVYTRNGLSPEALTRFGEYLRDRGQKFADDVDDWLVSNQDPPESRQGAKTGVGFYHYVVNDQDELEFSKDLSTEGDGL